MAHLLAAVVGLLLSVTLIGSIALRISHAAGTDGKWSGSATSDIGDTRSCTPTLTYEVVVASGKLTGTLSFDGRVQPIEATVNEDGSFQTTYANRRGQTVNVTGKVGQTFSVNNPASCGYGNLPLKK
jgi:hypothetical protein